MYTAIGCFSAKTKLSELLQGVKQGQRYTITLRGYPVADLVPSVGFTSDQAVRAAIEKMRHLNKVQGVPESTLTQWIAEGRR